MKSSWLDRHSLACLTSAILLCLLCSSGRVGNSDTGSQLDAAVEFAKTGHFWVSQLSDNQPNMWVRSPAGTFYQCHDLASQLVLVPAGFFSRHTTPLVDRPVMLSRVAAALTYNLIAAMTIWMVYHALATSYDARKSFVFALLFATGTIYWGYSKATWDVSGGAMGVAGLLAVLMRARAAGSLSWKSVAGIAIWAAVACSFRYSLIPFIGLAMVLLVILQRKTWNWRLCLATALLFVVCVAPTLAFNYVRTGSPIKPPTTAPQFDMNNKINSNPFVGALGLLLSPNRGIVWFTPAFVLLATLPWVYRRFPNPLWDILWPFLAVCVLYLMLIGSLRNWATFGWGPRYLVPILPILFIALAAIVVVLWDRWSAPIGFLLAVGVVLNGVAVFANWHTALAMSEPAQQPLVLYPAQQIATWKLAWKGIRGIPSGLASEGDSTQFKEFPDLLLFRISEQSSKGKLIALALAIAGGGSWLAVTAYGLRKPQAI